MAAGMSWNCEGSNFFEHILVYWVSAFLGLVVGLELNEKYYLPHLIIEHTVIQPVNENIVEPLMENVVQPVVDNVVQPVMDSVVQPVMDNLVQPVVDNVVQPVVDNVFQPVVDNVVDSFVQPIVDNVIHPVIKNVVDNFITPVVDHVVDNVLQPVTDNVMENVVQPLNENVVQPVVENVVQPMVENVTDNVVTPVVENVVQPLVDKLAGAEPVEDTEKQNDDEHDGSGAVNGACKQVEDADHSMGATVEDVERVETQGDSIVQQDEAGKLVKGTFNLADLEATLLKGDASESSFEEISSSLLARGDGSESKICHEMSAEDEEESGFEVIGSIKGELGAVGDGTLTETLLSSEGGADVETSQADTGMAARKRVRTRQRRD
jgi:hypothetical protein